MTGWSYALYGLTEEEISGSGGSGTVGTPVRPQSAGHRFPRRSFNWRRDLPETADAVAVEEGFIWILSGMLRASA